MRKIRVAGLKCHRVYISRQGSVYINVWNEEQKKVKEKIRVANHHENSKKLPKYNVLIGRIVEGKITTHSRKHYYSGYALDELVKDLVYVLKPNEKEVKK